MSEIAISKPHSRSTSIFSANALFSPISNMHPSSLPVISMMSLQVGEDCEFFTPCPAEQGVLCGINCVRDSISSNGVLDTLRQV
jgi:hypothetical protein